MTNYKTDTCGGCHHFLRHSGEGNLDGDCLLNPPVPLANGGVIVPRVRASRRACGQFEAGQPEQAEKQQPAVYKAQQRDRRPTSQASR